MSLMSPALADKFFTTSAMWEALLSSFNPYLALLAKVLMSLYLTFPGLCHE